MSGSPEPRLFTLHVDFLAVDEEQARQRAAIYADGLNQLRPKVDGVVSAERLRRRHGKVRPLWKLRSEQPADESRVEVHLVGAQANHGPKR